MNRGFLSLIVGSVLFWAGLVVLLFLCLSPGQANAMTVADVPVIPPQAVEVCERLYQTVCPIVAGAAPQWVTAPNTIDNMPPFYGRIVRFVANVNGEPAAWVRLADGGELLFPLRELTLVVDKGPR